MNMIDEAKKVFDIEIKALNIVRDSVDNTFSAVIVEISNCKGKVVVTGMGKSGHVGRKMAATMASLGTPAFFLHPAEGLHGDLGMLSKDDIVIAISFSGSSEEVIRLIPSMKLIGNKIISITSKKESTLAQYSDYVILLPPFEEACNLGLAPTSSTTAVMCYGDAIAVVLSRVKKFTDKEFGKFHPAGTLGKSLLMKVKDVMHSGDKNPQIRINSSLKDAIIEVSQKGLGMVSVTDDKEELVGIITDGDLRRFLEKGADVYSLSIKDSMTCNPYKIEEDALAIEALKLMNEKNITVLPVVRGNSLVGGIRIQDIVHQGILL